MSYLPIDELMDKMGSAYKMVILASRRVSALGSGAPPLVESKGKKSSVVVIEEILQDKIMWEGTEIKE
ncbi:MAG: DNA-directed RNA polymerase subunit omega [Candidatus Omnitrophica bacterium]|nr:DNA-directed RNA polymerase subunit omega [Candidatus Omnitrophota bacterium]